MSRYIDTDKIRLTSKLVADENEDILIPLSDVRRALEMTPTADVVYVVRCKDCKYFTYDNGGCCGKGVGLCFTDENQFCSYGERREK